MILVALLSLPFLFILARKPVLRRLALRNAVRRPRETALVILGSLLGTAIMTGSFVVGDTFNSSIRRMAYTQLGPVDEIVSANGLAAASTLRAKLGGLHDQNIDGTLALTLARASAASVTAPVRAAPKAQLLETDFTAARGFGGDAPATGMSGPTPGAGEAVIGADLARVLQLHAGDAVDAFAYGVNLRLRVARVLPKLGVAGFWVGDETASNNLFVAPGTIAGILRRSALPTAAPPQSVVLVSNVGGVEAGARRTAAVDRILHSRLGGVAASVNDRKQAVLDRAERSGHSLARLYTSLGAFAVLAGILLLVNIFFMLADERKSELGMLRAVGLRRSSLVGAFAAEGWCYAVLSAIAGTFVGLGLGRALMAAAANLFSRRGDDSGIALHFAFKWASVQRGLVVGFVIALATVMVTSVWLSRFNIIQAIRDITEPADRRPHRRSSYVGIVAALLGIALTGIGILSGAFLGLMLGPVVVFLGIAPLLARNFPRTAVNTVIGAIVLVWAVAAVPIAIGLGINVDVVVFVVQGLVLVGAAVVVTAQHQRAIGHGVGRIAKRSLSVRLGLAYPLARRFRTSMTLGMFALVVFILVLVSVFAAMFSGQIGEFTRDASGGFNVVVQSNPTNPVPFDAIAREPGVRAVAPLATVNVQVTSAPGLTGSREWAATGFDARFISHGAPKLNDDGTYPNDAAAYRAVLASPNLAIIEESFLASGGGPPRQQVGLGDHFTVQDEASGKSRTFTVAAITKPDVANNGVMFGMSAARELFGARAVANRAYVDARDPQLFADAFAGRFLANGGKAQTLRGVVQDAMAQQQQFFLLMRTYLALGLVVGIAGIGVIMVRAVRERRRQVGVLRALGFQAAAVRAAFVVESAFVAVEGVLLGTVLALLCAWSITLTDAFGSSLAFRIPFGSIGLLVAGTFVCALLTTAAPARSAARIRPAVALRLSD
ncbi:MAG TPA: FtsX-like permease family protein [Acidimicrobiia bacterium]|nr:FtsX-like permease family protein [Acidimicrobiia bacterium]